MLANPLIARYYFGMIDMGIPTFPHERVKDVRERLDLTQTEFAAQIGVSQCLVSQWENGDRSPTGPAAILLAQMAARADAAEKSLISA